MELEILRARLPGMELRLAHQVVGFVQRLRREELDKVPGVAESLDWMRALMALKVEDLTPEWIGLTLGTLLKSRDDIERERGARLERLLAESRETSF
jgi:MoxR-like ATPase